MRAFNLTAPTRNASYENAIQAGSLSHTGNSLRPIGGPQLPIKNLGTNFFAGSGPVLCPQPGPVRVTNGPASITTFNVPHGIVHRPNAPQLPFRGIQGT